MKTLTAPPRWAQTLTGELNKEFDQFVVDRVKVLGTTSDTSSFVDDIEETAVDSSSTLDANDHGGDMEEWVATFSDATPAAAATKKSNKKSKKKKSKKKKV